MVTLLAAVVILGSLRKTPTQRQVEIGAADPLTLFSPVSPLPCPAASALLGLSQQAATLTGSLALVEAHERPVRAAQAAEQIRGLVSVALKEQSGAELAQVLTDLAVALDKYAGGDPAGLQGVRETSARNAALRQELEQQTTTCGGDQ
jgi:hypothetical protein